MPNKNPQEWREFLEELSELIFEHASQRESSVIVSHLSEEMRSRRYVGFDGASETQICEAEKRLGVKFPPSYRTFLSVSNGWPDVWNAVEPGELWPTEKIAWTRDQDPEIIEIFGDQYGEEMTLEAHLAARGKDFGEYGANFMRNLLSISDHGDACDLVLCPDVVNASGDWECWKISSWGGVERFERFEDWFVNSYGFWKDQLEQDAKDNSKRRL